VLTVSLKIVGAVGSPPLENTEALRSEVMAIAEDITKQEREERMPRSSATFGLGAESAA
jgi:hypothetical protein